MILPLLAVLQVVVPNCNHRKFKLLFVLEDTADWGRSQRLQSELSAVNARLFPFAQQMATRGHTVQVADVDHFDQVLYQTRLPLLSPPSHFTRILQTAVYLYCH